MKRPRLVRMYKNLRAGGGVQSRLLELLPRLAEHFDVRVLCYRNRGERAEEMESAGIPVDLIPLGMKWAPWNVGRYVAYFRGHAPDVVHTHEYTANTLGIVAASKAGIAVRVRHIHTMHPWGEAGGLREAVRIRSDVRAAGRASVTLAVSEAARQAYLTGTGLPPESCRVLHNAVDLATFRSAGSQRDALRAEWGVAAEGPLVGVVARLAEGKGHPEFLRAAARIAAEVPVARFVVVGEGGSRDELEALVRELGLGEKVIFTGHRDDVAELLASLDLFVFASRAEGFGTAVLEAQAAGLPVVAFGVPALREIVVDGRTGRLVGIGDEQGLASAALGYLVDPEARREAGRAARKNAERFSLDTCVARTLGVYEEFMTRRRGTT